jgi:hypothetical protein
MVGGDLNDPTKSLAKPIGSDNVVFSCDLWNLLRERFPHRLLYETSFTQAKMASMLSTFEIEPQRVGKRRGKQVLRWYLKSDFDDPIGRYAPEIAAALLQTEEVPRSIVADTPDPHVVSAEPTEPPVAESVIPAPVAESPASCEGATLLHEEAEGSTVAPSTHSAPDPVAEGATVAATIIAHQGEAIQEAIDGTKDTIAKHVGTIAKADRVLAVLESRDDPEPPTATPDKRPIADRIKGITRAADGTIIADKSQPRPTTMTVKKTGKDCWVVETQRSDETMIRVSQTFRSEAAASAELSRLSAGGKPEPEPPTLAPADLIRASQTRQQPTNGRVMVKRVRARDKPDKKPYYIVVVWKDDAWYDETFAEYATVEEADAAAEARRLKGSDPQPPTPPRPNGKLDPKNEKNNSDTRK